MTTQTQTQTQTTETTQQREERFSRAAELAREAASRQGGTLEQGLLRQLAEFLERGGRL